MKPFSTPASVSQGMDILPSAVILNFLLERNGLINLIMLTKMCNLYNLYSKPECHVVSRVFFNIQEYRGHGYIIIEI
jgi:hypothetical protein